MDLLIVNDIKAFLKQTEETEDINELYEQFKIYCKTQHIRTVSKQKFNFIYKRIIVQKKWALKYYNEHKQMCNKRSRDWYRKNPVLVARIRKLNIERRKKIRQQYKQFVFNSSDEEFLKYLRSYKESEVI